MITTDLAAEAQRLRAERRPFVQATVVRAVRPTSVRPGDTALVLGDGTIHGFVGGTCAQTSVRLYAARALETDDPVLLRLIPGSPPADGGAVAEEGVVVAHNPCLSGGELEIFLDPQLPALRIVIAGDTPIALALEHLARAAGYDVERAEAAAIEPCSTDAAVIVASHGNDEEPALIKAIEAGVPYVGLVASPVRGAAVRESLEIPEVLRAWVHTPAGLDIGARAPSEIAIAILAEIVSERVANPVGTDAEREDRRPSPTRLPVVTATAIDPICGMEVVASDASIHLDVDGDRVYFCREGCRATYLERRAAGARAR
jgi:xanthine dehydrogenase accessory factor